MTYATRIARQPGEYLPALNKFRNALANVNNGTGRCVIALYGDSTFTGYGAGTDGFLTDCKRYSVPYILAGLIEGRGYPVSKNSVWGIAISPIDRALDSNPYVTAGGAWRSGSATIGGGSWANDTDTTTLTYSNPDSVDTIDVWAIRTSGLGTFNINIDGGANTLIDTAGADGIFKTTFSVSLGVHAVNIARASGSIFVVGFNSYKSTVPEVAVFGCGWGGSDMDDWTVNNTNAWNLPRALSQMTPAPHLSIFNLGINDWTGGPIPSRLWRQNYQALITRMKAFGDVILTSPVPSKVNQATDADQQTYRAEIYRLCRNNNLRLIDVKKLFGDWVRADAAGLMSPDAGALHPGPTGYALFAREADRVIFA